MVYYPKKQPKKATVISLFLYVCAIAMFILSSYFTPRMVYQLIGLVLVSIALFITSRYVLTDYKYVIKDAERASDKVAFSIIKVNGKREAIMANFDLLDVFAIEKCKKIAQFEKKHGKVTKFYGYTSNLSSPNTYMMGIEFNKMRVLFAIELNEEFLAEIKSRIPLNGDSENKKQT